MSHSVRWFVYNKCEKALVILLVTTKMPSKISHNDALEDMAAMKSAIEKQPMFQMAQITPNGKPIPLLLSLPQDLLFIIFQFLIKSKGDVGKLERTSKSIFLLVNNSNLNYNVWLLLCKRINLTTSIIGSTVATPTQIRHECKMMHLHSQWSDVKVYSMYVTFTMCCLRLQLHFFPL